MVRIVGDGFNEIEKEILFSAYRNEEGVYPYGFARKNPGERKLDVKDGYVYHRFAYLEDIGLLQQDGPIAVGRGPARSPYRLTVLGAVVLSEEIGYFLDRRIPPEEQ